jgi:hypothetical protein
MTTVPAADDVFVRWNRTIPAAEGSTFNPHGETHEA